MSPYAHEKSSIADEYNNTTASSVDSDWTVEIVPGHNDNLHKAYTNQQWDNLPDKVYITHLEDSNYQDVVDSAQTLLRQGITPVPHLAVRNITATESLENMVDRLLTIGVREVLMLGGNAKEPKGQYTCVLDALETGLFNQGFKRLHFAGFPEQNPDVSHTTDMLHVLAAKVQWATEHRIASRVVTQFCFDNTVIAAYLAQLQQLTVSSEVYIGIAGPINMTKLVKFSLLCGVGNSVKFLEKASSNLKGLIGNIIGQYDSNALIAQLQDSKQFIDGYHFFAFGNYLKTFECRQMS